MSKILNFNVYLSVLVLAAPLSLKHLTTKCIHFLQQEQAAGDTHKPWACVHERHAKTSRDQLLQLQLVHGPLLQGPKKTI